MQLDDAVIAITGGARGLGLAMARQLGERGARVALIDREGDALDKAVNTLKDAGIEAQAAFGGEVSNGIRLCARKTGAVREKQDTVLRQFFLVRQVAIEEIIGGTSYTRYLFLLRFHQQAIEILHFKPVILKSWRNLKFVGSQGLSWD